MQLKQYEYTAFKCFMLAYLLKNGQYDIGMPLFCAGEEVYGNLNAPPAVT